MNDQPITNFEDMRYRPGAAIKHPLICPKSDLPALVQGAIVLNDIAYYNIFGQLKDMGTAAWLYLMPVAVLEHMLGGHHLLHQPIINKAWTYHEDTQNYVAEASELNLSPAVAKNDKFPDPWGRMNNRAILEPEFDGPDRDVVGWTGKIMSIPLYPPQEAVTCLAKLLILND